MLKHLLVFLCYEYGMEITYSNHIKKHKWGFTLIELSIVLVIIGLLVGGVLVGRDLIEAGQLRTQIAQIEEYTTATHTFRLKYNCLPGDCRNAEALGLGVSAGPGQNGNGDKAIGYQGGSFANGQVQAGGQWTPESLDFWYHLQQAGLINTNLTGWVSGIL